MLMRGEKHLLYNLHRPDVVEQWGKISVKEAQPCSPEGFFEEKIVGA